VARLLEEAAARDAALAAHRADMAVEQAYLRTTLATLRAHVAGAVPAARLDKATAALCAARAAVRAAEERRCVGGRRQTLPLTLPPPLSNLTTTKPNLTSTQGGGGGRGGAAG
jgi:hypothetical protein